MSPPQAYEITVEVKDLHMLEEFTVQERENDGWASHKLSSENLNVSCIFSPLTAKGYMLEGKCDCRCFEGVDRGNGEGVEV